MLKKVLDDFEKKYKIQFAYDDDLVSNIFINTSLSHISVDSALKKILAPHKLSLNYIDELLIIHQKNVSTNKVSKLKGIVKDYDSGEIIPNTYISYANNLLISNYSGKFTINNYIAGKGDLKVSHLGYQNKFTLVSSDTSNTFVEIKLHSKPKLLTEVIVGGNSDMVNLSNKPMVIIINPERFVNVPGLGENDIMRSLQLLPGVQGINQGSAGLSVRGSSPSQNLVMLDGFTVFKQDHMFGWLSAINSNAIKSVQLYKSGFGAKYGGRASSVLDIIGRSGSTDKGVSGSISVNFLNTNLTGSTNIGKKATFFVGVRRSYTDFIQSPLFNQIFRREQNEFIGLKPVKALEQEDTQTISSPMPNKDYLNTGFSKSKYWFGDLYAKLTLKPNINNRVSISYYSSKDRQNSLQEASSVLPEYNINAQWGNRGIGITWKKEWNRDFYSNYSIGYSNHFSKNNLNTRFLDEKEYSEIANAQNLTELNLRLDHNWQMHSAHGLGFGLFATSNQIVDNFNNTVSTTEANLMGAYAQHQFKISPGLTLTSGLRGSYYLPLKTFFAEPRIEITHQANNFIQFKGSFGYYNQFLNNRESIDQSLAIGLWVLADDRDVPVILSKQYSAGILFTKNSWNLDAEVYLKNSNGIGLEAPVTESLFFADEQNMFNSGTGKSIGLDLMIKKNGKRYKGWVSYTISKSTMQFLRFNKGMESPALLDQPFRISVFNSYNLGNWAFSTTWSLAAGLPYYEPKNSNDFSQEIEVKRLSSTHQLNISALYSFNITKAAKSSIGISIINVYNQSNILSRNANRIVLLPSLQKANTLIYNDIVSIGITPTLMWQVSF